jgi:hypothetical protein
MRTRAVRRASSLVAILVAVTMATVAVDPQDARATTGAARCAERSLAVVLPTVQGTAAEAVAFMSIFNRGAPCQLAATASLTVVAHRARVAAIRGNPVRYRIDQTIGHGATPLFDAWWSNWCGDRGALRVRATMGALTGSSSLHILPVCLDASSPSRFRGVRYWPPIPVAGPRVTPGR